MIVEVWDLLNFTKYFLPPKFTFMPFLICLSLKSYWKFSSFQPFNYSNTLLHFRQTRLPIFTKKSLKLVLTNFFVFTFTEQWETVWLHLWRFNRYSSGNRTPGRWCLDVSQDHAGKETPIHLCNAMLQDFIPLSSS
jgi:hypothetical protein